MARLFYIKSPTAKLNSYVFRLNSTLPQIKYDFMSLQILNLQSNRYFNLIPYFGGKYVQLKNILPYIEKVAKENDAHTYIECFGGGGKCILNLDTINHQFKEKVYNEWDKTLCCLFKAASDRELAQQLMTTLRSTEYNEEVFKYCKEHRNDDVSDLEKARMMFITCLMSLSNNLKDFAKPRYAEGKINRFYNSVEKIAEAPQHLKNVTVVNGDYRKLMMKHGKDPQVVKYLDPPYHPACRNQQCLKVYPNELSIKQHREMVEILCESRSWILSGYDPIIYGSADYEPLVKAGAVKESIGTYSISPAYNEDSYKQEFIWYKL